ncbi:CRM1 C terminal-domain-containing protein [Gloeopeniophorella convolvens]|nr:CRM1 C terminal-domain-containing protein [Gloeopeniophorella convolvens]
MEALLDFSQDLNIPLLDDAVVKMYSGSGGKDQQLAQQVLTQFQNHPDAWTRVPDIIEKSSYPQTKYIGLQILEKLIATRWKTLPADQRHGVRNFVVSVVVKIASDEAFMRREKTYMNKLNLALIQILKQEWPQDWPNFIPELIESSRTNISLCENNMVILKLLSEEIFEFSSQQMTQAKAATLKSQFNDELQGIFLLCTEVLTEAQKTSLINATLETLLRFLKWIPLKYIFQTNIIDLLMNRFLEISEFRNATLKCLAEVAALEVNNEHDPKFVVLFTHVIGVIKRLVPPNTDVAEAYDNAADDGQQFILHVVLFLTSFLQRHLSTVETDETRDTLLLAHAYLLKISRVNEREIFKICIEYWLGLVAGLYEDKRGFPVLAGDSLHRASLGELHAPLTLDKASARLQTYAEALSELRYIVVSKMAKPEEVLVVENDEGEMVREFVQESDTIALYKSMRELLVYLTHLDVAETETILSQKLLRQMDGSEWSWNNLNTLCWAIGSISGTMDEPMETEFFIHVIKNLLSLNEIQRGKDNKVVVASNIMYLVGQYPRFLRNHWKFLRTVVNKLFEFMHEKHQGVQDMACDTFMTIAQKCRRQFTIRHSDGREPFINEILTVLPQTTVDLSPSQVHTFYKAVGLVVAAEPDQGLRELLISRLMDLPTMAWSQLLSQAAVDPSFLAKPETLQILINILRSYVSACSSIGTYFLNQLGRIYADMLDVYQLLSTMIIEAVARDGPIASKTPRIRYARTVKKEALRLVETFVKQQNIDLDFVNANLVPPFLGAILGNYGVNPPDTRDSEVLVALDALIFQLKERIAPQVPAIFKGVLEPTLEMIKQDFVEFPEHRVAFFKFLQTVADQCFSALPTLPAEQFSLFMSSVGWAIKHTQRDVAELGLQISHRLLADFAEMDNSIAKPFYEQYYLSIIQDTFFVLTDADHKSGFKAQSALLCKMIELVETKRIQAILQTTDTELNISNEVFVRDYIVNLLSNAFPHTSKAYLTAFSSNLFLSYREPEKFKSELRDFLIQLKEFAGTDNADLYLEEKEAELKRKAQADREAAASIPGMLKPSQIMDDEDI